MKTRLLIPALPLLLVVGCSNDEPRPAVDEPSSASSSPASAPLPLIDHVVPPDGLPGFSAEAVAEQQTLAAFAADHDKTVAELRKTGMVAGTSLVFEPSAKAEGFGLSVAAEFATEEQAMAEADRLFAANSEPEEGSTVTALEVPGIPGAQAVTLTGSDGGMTFSGVEIVFVDGLVAHELFAMGEDPVLVVADVIAAATALYERVAGRPLDDA